MPSHVSRRVLIPCSSLRRVLRTRCRGPTPSPAPPPTTRAPCTPRPAPYRCSESTPRRRHRHTRSSVLRFHSCRELDRERRELREVHDPELQDRFGELGFPVLRNEHHVLIEVLLVEFVRRGNQTAPANVVARRPEDTLGPHDTVTARDFRTRNDRPRLAFLRLRQRRRRAFHALIQAAEQLQRDLPLFLVMQRYLGGRLDVRLALYPRPLKVPGGRFERPPLVRRVFTIRFGLRRVITRRPIHPFDISVGDGERPP